MSIETRVIGKITQELESIYQTAKLLRDSSLTDKERQDVTNILCDNISTSRQGLAMFLEACQLYVPQKGDVTKNILARLGVINNGNNEKPIP